MCAGFTGGPVWLWLVFWTVSNFGLSGVEIIKYLKFSRFIKLSNSSGSTKCSITSEHIIKSVLNSGGVSLNLLVCHRRFGYLFFKKVSVGSIS